MRFKSTSANLKIYALAGTHTILLSMDMQTVPDKFLGFAFERTQPDTGQTTWLYGQKCFKSVVPNPVPGQQYPTQIHPVQSFLWKDFTASPGQKYTYKITALSGTSNQITYGETATIAVETENYISGVHGVIFNRGVSGSQAYAEKFGNQKPDDLPAPQKELAFAWLSNGLYENLVNFVKQATDSSYQLRCAFYEFHYEPFMQELKSASQRGVDVHIVYNATDEYKKINETAINDVGIANLCTPRLTQVKQPHNKFMILLKNNNPVKVWTGSTNISEVGIFGHSNAAHIVEDSGIAGQYLTYWTELKTDPPKASFVPVVEKIQPDLTADKFKKPISVFFSPRSSSEMLNTYASVIDEATELVCAVYPFNVDKSFQAIFKKKKPYLRYVLLNQRAKDNEIDSTDPNLEIVAGSIIKSKLDQWVKETTAKYLVGAGIVYIHNKFILQDPLSASPITITGSANFSVPSLTGNDENTLVILKELRVADIYFSEFVRLFDHFSFREWVNKNSKKFRPFLDEKYTWSDTYMKDQNSPEFKRRLLFAGMASAIESAAI